MQLFLLLIMLFFQDSSHALKSKVVGQAGEHFFTSREVQINYILEQALILPPERFKNANLKLPLDSRNFQLELNGTFLEWVVAQEAQAFSIAKVEEKDYKKASKLLSEKLKPRKEWNSLAVSKDEFSEFLRRKLRAKKFIQFKADSSVIEVTNDDAKDYYQRNKNRFGSVPYESFEKKIKTFLRQKKRNDRLQSWFEVLRKKYSVRSFLIGTK